MRYCVYLSVLQYGSVHIEAENEDKAIQKAENLYKKGEIDWHDDELTSMFAETEIL